MKAIFYSLIFIFFFSEAIFAKEGIISIPSSHSVEKTADKFESILKSKGFTIFNRIDHQKNAAGVNLKMQPATVIIFRKSKSGYEIDAM